MNKPVHDLYVVCSISEHAGKGERLNRNKLFKYDKLRDRVLSHYVNSPRKRQPPGSDNYRKDNYQKETITVILKMGLIRGQPQVRDLSNAM